jgi:hypothetical protein
MSSCIENRVSFVVVPDMTRTSENKQYLITDLADVRPFDSYVLVVMDYFAVYIPQVWVERFHYLRTVLKPDNGWKESSIVSMTTGGLKTVNLTDDLLRCFYKVDENIDFCYFHECVFFIFQGYSSFLSYKQKHTIRFLMPFIQFLNPCTVEVENWTKKASQTYSFLSDLSEF